MSVLRFSVLLAVSRLSSVDALLFNYTTTSLNNTGSAISTTTSLNNATGSAVSITISPNNATRSAISNATSIVQDVASACNAEYISWSLASRAYSTTGTIYVTRTITNTVNYNKTLLARTTFDCATKCDTICYATNVSSTISLSSISSEDTVTYTDKQKYTEPTPTCSIGFNDCLSLLTSYSSASSQWWDNEDPIITSASPIRPSCSACVSTGCAFQHGGMSLYYWPVTTSYSRDMCAWNPVDGLASTYMPDMNRTYAPTTTGSYAVVDDQTLYQGNVYLSIMEPYVYDNCGNSISRKNPVGNNVLTIASSDLYSVRKYPHNLIPWSMNYADFIEPVPWSAYFGGRYCANNRPLCSVVMPGEYQPVMVMPPQMRNLDPAWESCAFDQYGLFDPPVALQSVSGFLSSTTEASEPTQTPAEPGNHPPSVGPSATQHPEPEDPQPTQGHGEESLSPESTRGNGDENEAPKPTKSNGSPMPGNADSTKGNVESTKGNGEENNDPSPTQTPNDPSKPETPAQPPAITIGPSVIPIDPTGGVVVIPGITLSVGGPGIVISSTSLSIGSSGLVIISPATSTNFAFPPVPTAILIPGLADPIALNPTGEGTGEVVLAPGTTLSLGGPGIVISSTTFSVAATGLVIIAPASSTEIPVGSPGKSTVITLPGLGQGVNQLITLDSQGRLVMEGGKTLHAGDLPITIDGTTISVGVSKIVVVHGTVTENYDVPASVTGNISGDVKVQDVTAIGDLATGKGTRLVVGGTAETGAAVSGEAGKKGAAQKSIAGSTKGLFVVMLIAFWSVNL